MWILVHRETKQVAMTTKVKPQSPQDYNDTIFGLIELDYEPPVDTILDIGDLAAEETAQNNLRNQILSVASSSVGVALNDLTATQVKSLLAIMLWKAGAVNKSGQVRPLAEWVYKE